MNTDNSIAFACSLLNKQLTPSSVEIADFSQSHSSSFRMVSSIVPANGGQCSTMTLIPLRPRLCSSASTHLKSTRPSPAGVPTTENPMRVSMRRIS